MSSSPNISTPVVDMERRLTPFMFKWLMDMLTPVGFNGTIVTAKLTGGGTTGSLTFKNGRLISQVDAT